MDIAEADISGVIPKNLLQFLYYWCFDSRKLEGPMIKKSNTGGYNNCPLKIAYDSYIQFHGKFHSGDKIVGKQLFTSWLNKYGYEHRKGYAYGQAGTVMFKNLYVIGGGLLNIVDPIGHPEEPEISKVIRKFDRTIDTLGTFKRILNEKGSYDAPQDPYIMYTQGGIIDPMFAALNYVPGVCKDEVFVTPSITPINENSNSFKVTNHWDGGVIAEYTITEGSADLNTTGAEELDSSADFVTDADFKKLPTQCDASGCGYDMSTTSDCTAYVSADNPNLMAHLPNFNNKDEDVSVQEPLPKVATAEEIAKAEAIQTIIRSYKQLQHLNMPLEFFIEKCAEQTGYEIDISEVEPLL
jgi:hypothetical protein